MALLFSVCLICGGSGINSYQIAISMEGFLHIFMSDCKIMYLRVLIMLLITNDYNYNRNNKKEG